MPPVLIAQLDEIPDGGMIYRRHGSRELLLARVGGQVFALDDVCTHAGGPLHEGELGRVGDYLVTCPWHEAHFDLRDGSVHQDCPWASNTRSFRVERRGTEVWVDLE